MFKNVASQKIALYSFNTTTGAPVTGDAANMTPYVSINYGTVTVLGTTTATEMDSTNAKGWYSFTLAQAETNGDTLLFTAKSSTSNVSVVGQLVTTLPPNFSALAVNSSGAVGIQSRIKINTALPAYAFLMTDSTTHNPVTGKTVTVTRCIDTGSFSSGTLSSVTEISNGMYRVDIGAGDVNGNVITLRMTASGCDDLFVTLLTEP